MRSIFAKDLPLNYWERLTERIDKEKIAAFSIGGRIKTIDKSDMGREKLELGKVSVPLVTVGGVSTIESSWIKKHIPPASADVEPSYVATITGTDLKFTFKRDFLKKIERWISDLIHYSIRHVEKGEFLEFGFEDKTKAYFKVEAITGEFLKLQRINRSMALSHSIDMDKTKELFERKAGIDESTAVADDEDDAPTPNIFEDNEEEDSPPEGPQIMQAEDIVDFREMFSRRKK